MPLNDQARRLLDEVASAGGKPVWQSTPGEARAAAWDWLPYMGAPEPVTSASHQFIPGRSAELPVTVYTPEGDGPFPALLFLHGGGWVVGNIDLSDRPNRAIANATGCVVVAVNYQKAPEHPFPAPLDDAVDAFDWVVREAEQLGVDPAQVGVAGDSAGGNLAAALALVVRDRGGLAQPAFQILIYPALDPELSTPSAVDNADGYGLTTADMRWFWDQYLPDPADRDNPLASPLKAPDVSGLPPAVVVTVEYDPLRDDGQLYADRLEAGGVPVIRRHYPGTIHGILWMATAVEEYRILLRDIGEDVHDLLTRATTARP